MRSTASRMLPAALIAFGLLPILANAARRLATDAGQTAPISLPAIVHIAASTTFVILGALQFSQNIRRRRPAWHRRAGRAAVIAAVLAAGSGLWLAVDAVLRPDADSLLFLFRLLAGLAMLSSIVLGFVAVTRARDVTGHRAWMVRAYALGLGAATQIFTLGFGTLLFGESALSVALLNAAGWVINLAVAETALRRRPSHGARVARVEVTA